MSITAFTGNCEGAMSARKVRYIKMEFDSRDGNFHGFLPNGVEIVVDGDLYAEQQAVGLSQDDLESPLIWENCADGESIRVVKK